MTREEIRNAILSGKAVKKEIVNAFGVEIVLRQPSIGGILSMQDGEDKGNMVAQSLIKYCYVPGTEDKVFDEADADVILGLPFDEDFQKIQDGINKLMDINVDAEKKD